jgi:hypothetical protein
VSFGRVSLLGLIGMLSRTVLHDEDALYTRSCSMYMVSHEKYRRSSLLLQNYWSVCMELEMARMELAIAPVQTVCPITSQHEARAMAGMVVASLPFPPLPVMVLQGEDSADGMASSFDLLHTAILNWQQGLRPVGRDVHAAVRSKQETLQRLLFDMAALYKEYENCTEDVEFVERAYEIYCCSFRSYLLDHYATSLSDLRFYPLASVAPDSLLLRQGSSLWNAGKLMSETRECDLCEEDHFSSYSEMLRTYALDLGRLAHDV